jgi:ZIP family zinc transporter
MGALIAAGSGVVAGSMLLVGALIAWLFRVPPGLVASVTAFGAGVLISALAYELVAEAPELIAVITTIAAGGMLAMVCNTMIPAAFARDRAFTGLFATLGFLAAFTISHLP